MSEFDVHQRTSDGMFNATMLLKQWNEKSGQQKQMIHYSENNSTKEFIEALISEEDFKERNSVLLQSRGKKGGTWMHPLLFIDFAMWLNPAFKIKVLKFVYDEMIKYRHEAGDNYRKLSSSIGKIVNKQMMPVAMSNIGKALNHVVYGMHEKQIRNTCAEESKVKELAALESKISDLINEGFISNYDQVITYLRNTYTKKYTPKCLL